MNILERLQHDIKAPVSMKLIHDQAPCTTNQDDEWHLTFSIRSEDFDYYERSVTCSECGHIKDPEPEKKFDIQYALRLLRAYDSASSRFKLDEIPVEEANKRYEALKNYLKRR